MLNVFGNMSNTKQLEVRDYLPFQSSATVNNSKKGQRYWLQSYRSACQSTAGQAEFQSACAKQLKEKEVMKEVLE